ncbi:hypothetical protein L5515_011557 [Caenorhabditis briggsae]|uniref:Acyl_transf_3 domain-containing protein n=1 Tax=Caenorhabditis briggsae TaxID=6238 RepID=A0AAE9JH37_CAEBR|nr:hypothetical protein L5515_011557 [Caenorhabditis briggsae]
MVQPTKSKRLDLQGIRGLAILSVLGFHFYPSYFPNGYLGVDQFFILSGFLMCMLLTKSKEMPVCSAFLHFYSRRFKRILPLYLLFILLTLIALYTVFSESATIQNQSSAMKALIFVSNRPHTGEEDYFEKLLIAIDLFTHTWSLSVEIQFYFIVPIIFLIGNQLNGHFRYENGELVENVSLIDDFSENEDEEKEDVEVIPPNPSTYIGPFSKYCFLVPMAFVITYPIAMFPYLVRPLFTCFTGLLMLVSVDDEFLSNRVLTYIGDISYSLYLIHWPVYAYTKVTFENNPYALASGLLVSVILAVIVYETYEKWYLKLSNTSCALLIVFFFIMNVALINKDAIHDMNFLNDQASQNSSEGFQRLDGVTPNMTFDDAARLNKMWNKFDIETMIEPGCVKRTPKHSRWCDYETKGDEYKLAIFGNSYTKNHHKMFVQECKNRAYNITMDSERGCEPLAATPSDHPCVKKLSEFVEFIESAKPDYAFIFTRFFAVADPFKDKDNQDMEHDRTYIEMKNASSENEDGEKEDVEVIPPKPSTYIGPFSKYCFLVPMAFVITYPIAMFPFLVRSLFTFFTGLLMLVSVDDEFLSNTVLTYIGDISYSLYLIHWPVYAYTKVTFENNPYALASGLLVSVILAVIVYETYEKWYLKLSNTSCALLIVFLFIMNVALINKDANYDMKYLDDIDQASQNSSGGFQRLDGVTPNMTFDDAARLNEMWNKYDTDTTIAPGCVKRTPEHERWCDYKLKGDEFKLAIFGNSYTVNHHKMFVQECKNRAYNITMDSERGCEPLAASPNDHMCVEKLSEFVEFIESAKPDYAFIFTRFFAVADPFKDKDNQDMEHDRTYIEMKSQLNKFLVI